MKSFYRWISEHPGLCKILLLLLLLAFSFYAATLESVSFLTVYLIDLLIWFIAGRFIATVPLKLLQEPLHQLDQQGDPYPLMEELNAQLSRKFDGTQRQLLEMYRALTLRECGQPYKALETLENINIDKFPGTSPVVKYMYYHNLADLCYLQDRKDEGRIWVRKYRQIYNDLPAGKGKQELASAYEMMECEVLYHEGDLEEALKKVSWLKLTDLRMVLDGAMLAAKCHIALGEPEKAREKLQYILDHGNKLHIVQEATEILETLN